VATLGGHLLAVGKRRPKNSKTTGLTVADRLSQSYGSEVPSAATAPDGREPREWCGLATRYEKTAVVSLAGLHIAGIIPRSAR
jgi:hypothetical protein